MRKILLAVVIGSVALTQTRGMVDELVADAATNYKPGNITGTQPKEAPPTMPTRPARIDTPVPPPFVNPDAAAALRDESLRRQAALVEASKLIEEGQKLYYDAKYPEAIAKLEAAIRILPRAKATEIDYSRATQSLSDSYYRLADKAYRDNNVKKAKDLAQTALKYDPVNRSAENLIAKIKKQEREVAIASKRPPVPVETPAPDKTPEFTAKRGELQKLFREGKILMNSGQYDMAENRFKQILLVDPYNEDALELLKQLDRARQEDLKPAQDYTHARQMRQVTEAWIPPIGAEIKRPEGDQGGKPPIGMVAREAEITKKLSDIVFPEIKFREATITDVVQFLSEESRKYDPKKEGVNIVLGAGLLESGAAEAVPAPGVEPAPAAAPAAGGTQHPRITLSLRSIPMIEALKYITTLAKLKYRIESSAVLILPIDAPEGSMVTRSYPVSPGAFAKLVTSGAPEEKRTTTEEFRGMSGAGVTAGTVDIKALFTEAGVPFPAGSSLVYNERTSTLIVRNTPDNIEIFERVLPTFNAVPSQIEIEAKFVEVSQSDLDELGFNWKVGSRNFGDFQANAGSPPTVFETGAANPNASDSISGGLRDSTALAGNAIDALLAGSSASSGAAAPNQLATIRGILTNPQFELLIKALAQKKSTDTLSAPKVTTLSGVQAQIKVIQEFIYPTEFSEPTVASGNANNNNTTTSTNAAVNLPNITPSIPRSFKTREVGVVLNVTPTVGADGYTINLTLIPEVSEFLGFLDYSPTVVSGSSSIGFKIVQPLFSSRTVSTSIVIWDGQTVAIGGLMREDLQKFDDKTPFLGDLPIVGRLFRSKVTQRTKRNLLIFVSARLIDPAGNRIHRDTTASLR